MHYFQSIKAFLVPYSLFTFCLFKQAQSLSKTDAKTTHAYFKGHSYFFGL